MTAAAQMTAKRVVANNLEARGGAGKFAAIRSLSYAGTLEFGAGQSAPMSVWLTTRPARVRIEIQLPQGKMIEAYDGKRAWQIIPGEKAAAILHGAAARRVRDQALNGADVVPNLHPRARLVGSGKRAGHRYYIISFAFASGDVFTQSIDGKTWLAFHETYPGGAEEISSYQNSGDLLVPTQIVCGPQGQHTTTLHIQHTAFNAAIPAAMFQPPVAPRAATRPGKP
ncbi:MAG: hypothetical protein ACRD0Y_08160 [Terriglobales bacterium]